MTRRHWSADGVLGRSDAADAGVVHKDVDAAEAIHDRGRHVAHRSSTKNPQWRRSRQFQTLQGTQCGVRMLHVVDANGVAALRQHLGCAPAYALSRTGDEGYLEFPMH